MSFDYIIYPANMTGIITAKFLSQKGKVLLLNKFGFMGGDITSALNLFQQKPKQESSLVGKMINSIPENEILYEDTNKIIFSPEYFKFLLQEFIQNEPVEFLFHVRPFSVNLSHKNVEIRLSAREGTLSFNSKFIYDFSDNQELSVLSGKVKKTFRHQKLNFITTRLDKSVIAKTINSDICESLKDGRNFISQKLKTDKQDELEAQRVLNSITELLMKLNARIQLSPAESLTEYSFSQLNTDERLFDFSKFSLLNKPDERLITSEIIGEYFEQE